MERRSNFDEAGPSEKAFPDDPERTVVAPRFDRKSIQSAQPAVPLEAKQEGRRKGPLTFVVLCIVAGIAGGLLGAFVLSSYQRKARPRAQPAATLQPTAERAASQTADAPPSEAARLAEPTPAPPPSSAGPGTLADADPQAALRGALDEWIAATNARDLSKQMSFYNPTVNTFYLSRNASREAVRAEKARILGAASAVDVRAGAPDIKLSRDGRTATMRFRKKYAIEGGGKERRGEVLQELRWQRTSEGWKIVSERDLRVIQ
ncbi:MAG: nuclear transport factor 2 family protein [Acidobacteria bacterium]|nr:nuclear transport factor 2 family protein [Acidobacteriota bacterium]